MGTLHIRAGGVTVPLRGSKGGKGDKGDPGDQIAPSNVDTFIASGTWTKPVNAQKVIAEIWGGGGGGGAGYGVNQGGGGGGGGGYVRKEFNAADLPASVPITIGAGGVAGIRSTSNVAPRPRDGKDGGWTSFGSLLEVSGGLGGEGYYSSSGSGMSKGGNGGGFDGGLGGSQSGSTQPQPTLGATWGGGGGGGGAFPPGGGSIYGGAGGNAANVVSNVSTVSVFGGNGGMAGVGGAPGYPGSAPAGGGGGSAGDLSTSAGPGARGEARITTYAW